METTTIGGKDREMDISQLVRDMPAGKSLSKRENGSFRCVRHSPTGDGYHVLGSYLLPAQYDEDPESIMCGCPFAMQSHAHVESDNLTADADAMAEQWSYL